MNLPSIENWAPNWKPRKPSVIGIGAQKAGTTWLHDALGQHPGIWAPPFKESHFFDQKYDEGVAKWARWHINRTVKKLLERFDKQGKTMPGPMVEYFTRLTDDSRMFSQAWYRDIFAPAPPGTRPMDITPEFSILSEDGVQFIKDTLPRAQFIYVIRHPVDRAVSQLKMNLMRQNKRPKTDEEWLAQLDNPDLYSRGDYLTYIPRWRAHFGPDRLLILPFGQIARDPHGFLHRIEEFLDLPAHSYQNVAQKVFAAPKYLSVPDHIRAELRRRLEPQFDYLHANFDDEFCTALR